MGGATADSAFKLVLFIDNGYSISYSDLMYYTGYEHTSMHVALCNNGGHGSTQHAILCEAS